MKYASTGARFLTILAVLVLLTALQVLAQTVAIGRASNIGDQAWIATGDWTKAPPTQTTGAIHMSALDATANDSADSKDAATMTATFKYPADGPDYTVKLTNVTPRGGQAKHYGGVAMMRWVMGPDNLVGMPMPKVFAYIGAFGRATIAKNGETIATNQSAYIVVTQGLHDENHKMMESPDPTRQEIHLLVPGSTQTGQSAVAGFPDGNFYVYWPNAAFEVANIGGSVTMAEPEAPAAPAAPEVTTPEREPPTGMGPVRLMEAAGKPLSTIDITLTDTSIRKKMASMASGLYEVRVTNDSSRTQGIVYRGTDLCCTEYVRFSTMIMPRETQSFRWYFAPGKVTMRNYLGARKTGSGFTDVTYGRLSSSIAFR